MPVVNFEQYKSMLRKAKDNKYAFTAINVTSTSTANAALQAFAENNSDGIIQVSTGGGKFCSGQAVSDMAMGAISIAEHVHKMAAKLNIGIALHTDHCHPKYVDSFLMPLVEETKRRRALGLPNLFNSHMFDGSELPLKENLKISSDLLKLFAENDLILEMETGVVGGEEDGVNNENQSSDKLYTSKEEMLEVAETLRPLGFFMYAATFGNVHGVYKPGNVKLKPSILKDGQSAVVAKLGKEAEHLLVFHGGSGSEFNDIQETLNYGVVKMNVDTDTQYAYTRPVVDFILKNYDQILKIEGNVGNKKFYDPRVWSKLAENGMKDRISRAIKELHSDNKSIFL